MTATFHWLLDVDGPGLRLRYTSSPSSVTVSGVVYRPGLAQVEAAIGDEGVDVSVLDPSTDWPRVAASITMVPCSLRRWRVGSASAAAVTFARGAVFSLEHGSRHEVAAWRIRESSADAMPACPGPDTVVDTRTSPQLEPFDAVPAHVPSSSVGDRMPIVFGWPGYDAENTLGYVDTFAVVPCPCWQVPDGSGESSIGSDCTIAQIVISEDPRTTNPSQVIVDDGENIVNTLTQTTVVLDLLSHPHTVAGFAGADDDILVYPEADEAGDVGVHYLVGYSPAGDAAPMRDLYDVVSYMLGRFGGATVDRDRLESVREVLTGYQVDWFVNDDVGSEGVWGWLETLLNGMPFAIRRGPRGRYLQFISATPDPRKVSRELDVSRGGVRRAGSVAYVGDNPFNEFVGRFGAWPGGDQGAYFGTAVVGAVSDSSVGLVVDLAEPTVVWDRTTSMTYQVCVVSQSRYGRRVAPDVQIPWTWDRATAYRVLQNRADRESLPYRRVRYTVPEELGIVEDAHVRITDAELGIDTLAIVEGQPLIGGASGAVVTLRIPGR